MVKLNKTKFFPICSLLVATCLLFFSFNINITSATVDTFSETEQKLADISEEEKNILQNLFAMEKEIEELERNQKALEEEEEAIKVEIKELEFVIKDEEKNYEEKKDILKQVLRSYQRGGAISYMEILLDSDNLKEFLDRINILLDLTRNTKRLLESIAESRDKLLAEKEALGEKLNLLEENHKKVEEMLAQKRQLKEKNEKYLASLKDQRAYYENYLDELRQEWNTLRILFSNIAKEFSSMMEEEKIPLDAIKMSFSLFEIKGSIAEKVFNDAATQNPRLSGMVFNFYPGKVDIEIPDKKFVLTGTFTIQNGHILQFEAEEGSFYGIPLGASAVKELFLEGYPTLDFKPFLGNYSLDSLRILEDELEFIIKPAIFRNDNKGGAAND
ncbi:MAG: hypothetical protein GX066_06250 [Clostridiaceae bacterium]|nr:hypothetical protein [Clostridiaceae bacterium]